MRIIKNIIAVAAALTCLVGAAPAYSAVSAAYSEAVTNSTQTKNVFASSAEAAIYAREQLVKRNTDISVTLPGDEGLSGGDLMNKVIDLAVAETGVGNEGDYLRMSMAGHGGMITRSSGQITLDIHVDYYTDAEQEKFVAGRIASIISGIKPDGKSEYERILSAYKWATANISYADNIENDVVFTAYGALHNGKAVCQGYAQVVYRLLREMGISTRMITGAGTGGGSHVWLIAEADGWYYYIDPTYDGGEKPEDFMFFMKGTEDFDLGEAKHIPSHGKAKLPHLEPDYYSEEFNSEYPINVTEYVQSSPAYRFILGDVDLNGSIDAFDLTTLRQGILYGIFSERSRLAADVDGDGSVKVNDLVLLQSYLMGRVSSFADSAAL
ncbi:MAG: hypothetical protein GXY08_09885 [Ruminococcus sp.]|nr:hypothetical protein [Ruminococcus sp.]